jgi:hypothetical protein
MRPKLVLGWGLAGVVAGTAPAAAQFASDRPASPPPPPAAATPGANAPGSTNPTTHPWYVKPEHGAWMICVKSYAGPTAKAYAEELAREIRETYRVNAYLFEKGSEEKKRQDEYVAKEKARQQAEQQKQFLELTQKMREEAYQKGMDFMESPIKLRVPKYLAVDEQWAVLVGGWKDMEAASKELKKVRGWQPPKNADLMDRGVISRPGENGQRTGEVAHLNPFLYAMVFPNPAAPRPAEDDRTVRAIYRLNEKEDLSVLRIAKPWTLVVKSFHPPVRMRDKDGEKSVVERLFGPDEGAKELQATALQAVSLAKALRDPKFKPHPLDAHVLHTLYGSMVCVGQFDGPEDPAMLATQQTLDRLTFHVQRQDEYGTKSNVRLFDPLFAIQIPRPK